MWHLDVSTSFKRLQAEKAAADAALRESIHLESVGDSTALRDDLKNMVLKTEVCHASITVRGVMYILSGSAKRDQESHG